MPGTSCNIPTEQNFANSTVVGQPADTPPAKLFSRVRRRVFWQSTSASLISTDISLPLTFSVETAPTFDEEAIVSPILTYRNSEAVKDYLNRHPDLEDFINRAWPAVVECFGGPVEIVLELLTYPDESAHQELVGWIQSTDTVEVGLERLEQLENTWFLDHMDQVGDRFNFNIETR